jgi:hypothetical protein
VPGRVVGGVDTGQSTLIEVEDAEGVATQRDNIRNELNALFLRLPTQAGPGMTIEPPPPSQPPPQPSSSPGVTSKLSPATCDRAFRTPHHLFRRMWAREARRQIERRAGGHDLGCWDFIRDCHGDGCTFEEKGRSADTFWDEMRAGTHCGEDWYEGSGDAHGWLAWPSPALLGFDDGIHAVCNNNCDGAGFSILELFSWRVPYNTCRNFEWQVCCLSVVWPPCCCRFYGTC